MERIKDIIRIERSPETAYDFTSCNVDRFGSNETDSLYMPGAVEGFEVQLKREGWLQWGILDGGYGVYEIWILPEVTRETDNR